MSLSASIKFLGNYSGKPRLHGLSREKDNCPLVECNIKIHNARTYHTPPHVDDAGYMLARGDRLPFGRYSLEQMTVRNFDQNVSLLRSVTAAQRLVHLNSVIRRSEKSPFFMKDGTTLPARYVHSDYGAGEIEIERWVNRILGAELYNRDEFNRVAMYNIWRPLSPPPTDVPLALCDVRSLEPGDRVGVEFIEELPESNGWSFEMSVYHYSDSQRWGFFPDMQDDELIIFKGFDSDDTKASLTPHAAFSIQNCPDGIVPRESIESRFLAIF